MLKTLLATVWLLVAVCVDAGGGCNCEDDDGFFFGYRTIMETQRVSDMMIAVAYFSIPIELLYFVSCSNVPFKWVLFEFIAFIVLCGMTHFLTWWTYEPHPFHLMLALTVFKFLTALVSFATAITLITLIPLLLKLKVREFMLRKKTRELGREMGVIQKQKDAGLHVRMLTQEIRKSLDRHTILYTTLDKLSQILDLQKCAVWMPDPAKTVMNLTHQRGDGDDSSATPTYHHVSVPIQDPDVQEIKRSEIVKLLDPKSPLALSDNDHPHGAVAAIRMPMLRVSDFKQGTPENNEACYAILVLVLPGGRVQSWTEPELEIVKVVADQVAVALSHAAVLEESQLMRDKLAKQNRALQQAKHDAMRASRARNLFQTVMSKSLRKPMHSIVGLLSILQDDENLSSQQRVVVESTVKTSNVVSMLIDDVMDDGFLLEMRPIRLHSVIKESVYLAKCLCSSKGYRFVVDADKAVPDSVMGDERRVFQVILHMIGSLLRSGGEGVLTLRILMESGSSHGRWVTWKSNSNDVNVKFEVGINDDQPEGSGAGAVEQSLSFGVCRKLVEMMQGKIWVVPNPVGFDQSMALVLRFQLRSSTVIGTLETEKESLLSSPSEIGKSDSAFRGLQVLLAEEDESNRAVTRKLLEKLGCIVSTVATGSDCIRAPSHSYQMVILDLEMSDVDGFEVASRIRKSRSSQNWPLIVAITAVGDNDVWERCLQTGINGVIKKPVVLKAISGELRRVLIRTNNLH